MLLYTRSHAYIVCLYLYILLYTIGPVNNQIITYQLGSVRTTFFVATIDWDLYQKALSSLDSEKILCFFLPSTGIHATSSNTDHAPQALFPLTHPLVDFLQKDDALKSRHSQVYSVILELMYVVLHSKFLCDFDLHVHLNSITIGLPVEADKQFGIRCAIIPAAVCNDTGFGGMMFVRGAADICMHLIKHIVGEEFENLRKQGRHSIDLTCTLISQLRASV